MRSIDATFLHSRSVLF